MPLTLGDIIFSTTDPSRWGDGKNPPGPTLLTDFEVDRNFWAVLQAIIDLQNNPTQPAEIIDVTTIGDQMTITLDAIDPESSEGDLIQFVVTLPRVPVRFRGPWAPETAYLAGDFFTAVDGLYLTTVNHTSSLAPFNPDDGNMVGPFATLVMPYQNLYEIAFFSPGTPGTGIVEGEAIFSHRTSQNWYLLAGAPGSVGGLEFAATDPIIYPVYKNRVQIGNFIVGRSSESEYNFGPDSELVSDEEYSQAGVFDIAADVQFTPSERLRVLKPADDDLTARDLTITFWGIKGTL